MSLSQHEHPERNTRDFPQGRAHVARGDLLRHHSVSGVYEVVDVTHGGQIIVRDPRGEQQRLWADYIAENFTVKGRRS